MKKKLCITKKKERQIEAESTNSENVKNTAYIIFNNFIGFNVLLTEVFQYFLSVYYIM